jgi:hypothetical protein
VLHAEPHRSYALGAPTPEGDALQLDYVGQPGDLVGVFAALAPAWMSLPGKQGTWHLAGALFGPFLFGPIDATGELHLAVPIGELGLGPDDALLLHEQALVTGVSGPATLSSPTLHLIVDGSL